MGGGGGAQLSNATKGHVNDRCLCGPGRNIPSKKADVDDRLCSCNPGRNSTSKKGDVDDRCWCDPDRNVTSKKEISTSVFIILLVITFLAPI